MALKVLIADDHSIVRVGLTLLLKKIHPHVSVIESRDFREALEAVAAQHFDLMILDVNMANGNYQDAIDIIRRRQPRSKILIFSSLDEQLYAIRYLQTGADGFLHKLASENEVEYAVKQMLNTGKYISEKVKENMISSFLHGDKQHDDPLEILSNRELDIARFLIQGLSLKEIATRLNLHVATVSTYKTRIFEKMAISRVTDLIERFRIHGIVPGEKI
ncbi:LuxR family two component transcriptional regulator [Anseongella ginsenosidimutans]|uniref:LuxR family two component transcriptional regulator n=1 Tax=Anseongella ginsenosidimutans TaxID=496056 RepID=A0A4R3KQC0_9SPHI|nr:response regulator transcription factor [Anseongella ginsenosidimutans]QEC53961.1 response regulator transcription factor [Anseongella ginsenosidimutans]TCS86347.1 LuxR family two component transcriptional regulator [Anseongella ginsenosidimutans]